MSKWFADSVYVKKREVAKCLSCSLRTIERLIAEGVLHRAKIRGATVVVRASVVDYVRRTSGVDLDQRN